MARVTCAISGIKFNCSYLENVNISHKEGYFHPIFALPYKNLHKLYTLHCKGELTSNDSFLLFIAFLHSSGKIKWIYPVTLDPNKATTKALIENNLAQLIRVLEMTAVIKHPGFKQPEFKVTVDNSDLRQIPNWIEAWQDNIKLFNNKLATIREIQSFQEIENRLSKLILSGRNPQSYAPVIARWASAAGDFPPHLDTKYQEVIRSCFNMSKMFNTDLSLIKEIKGYCENNITAGSIHFHSLMEVLREGINRHINYLGGTSLSQGYTMISDLTTEEGLARHIKEEKVLAELAVLASKAPEHQPKREDYTSVLDYIKDKSAYRVACSIREREEQVFKEKEEADLRELKEMLEEEADSIEPLDLSDPNLTIVNNLEELL